jgi:60 kDa SS-A/Ro ribonucleoprotein
MPGKKSSSTNKAKKPSAAATAMAAQAAQAVVIRNAVPQWFRLDPDQIQGAAGGFVWQITDKEQVIRYLIIGSEGGNFYQTPQQVSSQCASCVLRMTRTPDNFKWLIETIRQVSMEGRAAKQESTLLALATAIVFARTPEAKTEALNAVKDCVRILTHMYMLIGYIKIFSKAGHPSLTASATAPVVGSGLGRGIRRVFGEYFYSRTGIEIANLMTKYQNREGWTIKDVLTLIHIDPKKMKDDGGRLAIENVFKTKEEFAPILAAAPPTAEPTKTLLSAIKEIHAIAERPLQPATNPSLAGLSNYQYSEEIDRMVSIINSAGLCREHLPSQLFKHKKIWEALLMNKGANGKGKGMPLTALIRNLGKLSSAEIGIIENRFGRDESQSAKRAYSFNTAATAATPQVFPIGNPQHYTEYIFRRLTNARDIKYSRIHPYNILVAMLTYKKGCGDKGSLTWTPNLHIMDALDHAFKLAFQNITPTGKRIKIALDVSGSMSSAFCTGSPIVSCAIGSVAMMMMTLYIEKGVPPPHGGATLDSKVPPYTKDNQSAVGGGPTSQWWKTTQLPDGRTLYEHTETGKCQFDKPQESSSHPGTAVGGRNPQRTPPKVEDYKKTKQYLGLPNPVEGPRSGYHSSYTPPAQHHYLPELYPSPTTPSNVTICAFSNTIIDLTNTIVGYMDATIDPTTGLPTMTIDDALKLVDMPFSSTDCALPMVQALQNREKVDAFVIYTDSETYMGKIHPQAALEEYRRVMGIDAKLIVVGMTSNCLTIADPKDLNTLNLAGFDTATPRIINDFISGGLLPPTTTTQTTSSKSQTQGDAAAGGGGEDDDDEFIILTTPDEE